MAKERIPANNGNGFYNIKEQGEFEFVDPLKKAKEQYINSSLFIDESILLSKGIDINDPEVRSILISRALAGWVEMYGTITDVHIPKKAIKLLESNRKKEQLKLVKGLTFNTISLQAFIILAGEYHGYSYSFYKSEFLPTGMDEAALPKLAYHDPDETEVKIAGETQLNEKQIKGIIKERSVKIAKFLDREDEWHCFFYTYRSLRSEENHQNGLPHLHYISNRWGIPRREVVKQIKSKHYKLPQLPHIPFER